MPGENLPQTRAELDAYADQVANKRLKDAAALAKEAGIDKELALLRKEIRGVRLEQKRLNTRVDASNHLKESMVTNDVFNLFKEEWRTMAGSLITRESLGGSEIWVHAGVPHGLTPPQMEALQAVADEKLEAERVVEKRAAVVKAQLAIDSRRALIVNVVTQLVGSVLVAGTLVVAFLTYLNVTHKGVH